jgi:hypothetical protein
MRPSNLGNRLPRFGSLSFTVAKGTTLLDLGLGIRIGARAGWSPERVNDLSQQENALMQAIIQSTPTGNGDLWTCDGVRPLTLIWGKERDWANSGLRGMH